MCPAAVSPCSYSSFFFLILFLQLLVIWGMSEESARSAEIDCPSLVGFFSFIFHISPWFVVLLLSLSLSLCRLFSCVYCGCCYWEPETCLFISILFFYLQYGEVLEDAVHHVLLGQVFELVDKVDHVLAHGRTMDAVDEAAILQASVLRLDLLDHLLAERTHLCRTGDGHVLVALVPNDKR